MFSVLVVEDDIPTNKLMTIVLKNGGYKPIPAFSSSEALKLFESEKPDLVLADVMLPDVSGFRLTEAIRRCNADVPIIIVTAKQSPSDKHYGFMVGAQEAFEKQKKENEEKGWGLVMITPQEVTEHAKDFKRENFNKNAGSKLDANAFGIGYTDGKKFDPTKRLEA